MHQSISCDVLWFTTDEWFLNILPRQSISSLYKIPSVPIATTDAGRLEAVLVFTMGLSI